MAAGDVGDRSDGGGGESRSWELSVHRDVTFFKLVHALSRDNSLPKLVNE